MVPYLAANGECLEWVGHGLLVDDLVDERAVEPPLHGGQTN